MSRESTPEATLERAEWTNFNLERSLLARPRRLRQSPLLRDMVRETTLRPADFIRPIFVHHGTNVRNEISSLPGVFQFSIDHLKSELTTIVELGIHAVILFGIPETKDAQGSDSTSPHGIIQRAIGAIKEHTDKLVVISDVCFCEYTDHGHCGALVERAGGWDVDNDATLPMLVEQSISHARAGADVIAPSGMMDGFVSAIRNGLDQAGFSQIPILAYSAKFASGFYGPFREAAASAPSFGDRASYQMDPANGREAVREIKLDLEQGADMVMVKPALSYLDVIAAARRISDVPVVAYNVSGEYAMVKAAAKNGWLDERRITLEILTSIKRAGADLIITYHAKEAAGWLLS